MIFMSHFSQLFIRWNIKKKSQKLSKHFFLQRFSGTSKFCIASLSIYISQLNQISSSSSVYINDVLRQFNLSNATIFIVSKHLLIVQYFSANIVFFNPTVFILSKHLLVISPSFFLRNSSKTPSVVDPTESRYGLGATIMQGSFQISLHFLARDILPTCHFLPRYAVSITSLLWARRMNNQLIEQ